MTWPITMTWFESMVMSTTNYQAFMDDYYYLPDTMKLFVAFHYDDVKVQILESVQDEVC